MIRRVSKFEFRPTFSQHAAVDVSLDDKEQVPIHKCRSCERCKDSYCDYFERPVVVNYNRCFMHSLYNSTPNLKFIPPTQAQINAWREQEDAKDERRRREFKHSVVYLFQK